MLKVRIEEQEDSLTLEDESISLPVLEKLLPQSPAHFSSVKEKKEFLSSGSKTSKAYVPKLESRKNRRHTKELHEDPKLHIRASSTSRPRAIISSPENDKAIGKQNKLISKRCLTSKKQSLDSYSISQVKDISNKAKSPLSQGKSFGESTGSKQWSSMDSAVPRQRNCLLTRGKPNCIRSLP